MRSLAARRPAMVHGLGHPGQHISGDRIAVGFIEEFVARLRVEPDVLIRAGAALYGR